MIVNYFFLILEKSKDKAQICSSPESKTKPDYITHSLGSSICHSQQFLYKDNENKTIFEDEKSKCSCCILDKKTNSNCNIF